MRLSILLAIVMCTSACAKEADPTEVRVLADGEYCVVGNQQIRCDAIGPYLRDTLRVTHDSLISVSVDGTERSQERGRRVSSLLRSADYLHIVIVGFITEPGQGKSK